jgi:hypothetical protein
MHHHEQLVPKPPSFKEIRLTELDGGLSEDNKTVYTTTWRLDYDGRRVHFLKSKKN